MLHLSLLLSASPQLVAWFGGLVSRKWCPIIWKRSSEQPGQVFRTSSSFGRYDLPHALTRLPPPVEEIPVRCGSTPSNGYRLSEIPTVGFVGRPTATFWTPRRRQGQPADGAGRGLVAHHLGVAHCRGQPDQRPECLGPLLGCDGRGWGVWA